MSTCPTCVSGASAPPRARGRSCNSANPVPCLTSKPSPFIVAGPTELLYSHLPSKQSDCESCAGTCTAPSRVTQQEQGLPGSLPTHNLRDQAWDKIPRLGEAKNPGPEPPRELYVDSKNGQRDPIRLCTQDGVWVWNVHSVPPLRVAKRPTPHEALRNWLTKHEPAITPSSAETARQLAQAWEEHPMPQPIRRTRSMPPREFSKSMDSTSASKSPPREETQAPVVKDEGEPRRRIRGKSHIIYPISPPPSPCLASQGVLTGQPELRGRPEPYGCWDEIYEVMRRPVLVDRHIPRELKALWQKIMIQLLTTEQSRTDVYPIASDLVFILPKLLLSHPPGKARDRLHRIQNSFQRASQGEWKSLIERVLEIRVPKYEQDESQPQPSSEDSPTTLQSSVPGTAGESMAAAPSSPASLHRTGPGVKHWQNSHHMKNRKAPLSERTSLRKDGSPLPGSITTPFRN